jgi:hypothetical protein
VDHVGHATSITAANDTTTMWRYANFGQKVMAADPDPGVTLFRYDAAVRMVARIDDTMVATRFTFDHANRLHAVGILSREIIARSVISGSGGFRTAPAIMVRHRIDISRPAHPVQYSR